jgi:hypothetical protein
MPAAKKGFSFTLEALISLILVTAIISVPVQYNQSSLNKIYALQKENDLIKVWIKTKNFKEEELKKDFKKMFPFQKGEIEIEGKKIEIEGIKGKNSIKSSGFYYENGLKKISVKVFI